MGSVSNGLLFRIPSLNLCVPDSDCLLIHSAALLTHLGDVRSTQLLKC